MGFCFLIFLAFLNLVECQQFSADKAVPRELLERGRLKPQDFHPIHVVKRLYHNPVRQQPDWDNPTKIKLQNDDAADNFDEVSIVPTESKPGSGGKHKYSVKVKYSDDVTVEPLTTQSGFFSNMWSSVKDIGKKVAVMVGAEEETTESSMTTELPSPDNSAKPVRRSLPVGHRHLQIKKSTLQKRRRIPTKENHTTRHYKKSGHVTLTESQTREHWTTAPLFTEYVLSNSPRSIKPSESILENELTSDSILSMPEPHGNLKGVPNREQEYVDEEQHIRKEVVKVKKTGPKPNESVIALFNKLKKESTVVHHEGQTMKIRDVVNVTTEDKEAGEYDDSLEQKTDAGKWTADEETLQTEDGLNDDSSTEIIDADEDKYYVEQQDERTVSMEESTSHISDVEEDERVIDNVITKNEPDYEGEETVSDDDVEILLSNDTSETNTENKYENDDLESETESQDEDETEQTEEYISNPYENKEDDGYYLSTTSATGTTGVKSFYTAVTEKGERVQQMRTPVHQKGITTVTMSKTEFAEAASSAEVKEESVIISDEKFFHRIDTQSGGNKTINGNGPVGKSKKHLKAVKKSHKSRKAKGKNNKLSRTKSSQSYHETTTTPQVLNKATTTEALPTYGLTTTVDILMPPTHRLARFKQNKASGGVKHLPKAVEETIHVVPVKGKNVIDVINKESISVHNRGVLKNSGSKGARSKDKLGEGTAGKFDLEESHVRMIHLTEDPVTHEKSGSLVDRVKISKTHRRSPRHHH